MRGGAGTGDTPPGVEPRTVARTRTSDDPPTETPLTEAPNGSAPAGDAPEASSAAGAPAGSAADGTPELPSRRVVRRIMVGLVLAMLTSMLTNSIVGTALPTIMGELGGQDRLAWVATAALLTMTASTPVWGKLSDVWGRKLLFQLALGIFIVASVAAGLAQDINWLIAARALQGLGVGGLATLPNIILGDVVPPRERGRYSGLIGMVFGVSTVLGPLVGGFLVDSPLGWRWCFLITVPLALFAFVVIQFMFTMPFVPRRDAPVDWLGAGLIFSAASTVIVLLSLGGTQFPWNSPLSYALGAGALLLTAAAVVVERRAREPIIPARLFGDRTFVLSSLGSACVGMMMFGLIIYMPQYLQMVHGMTPTVSGLMTLPLVASFLLTSIGSGYAVGGSGRWKAYPVTGMALCLFGFAALSLAYLDTGLTTVVAGQVMVGLGLGLCMQILLLATQSALPLADMATGTASVVFFRNLGGATGVAAFGAVMVGRLNGELAQASADARARVAADAAAGTDSGARELSVGLSEAAEAAQGSPELVHSLPGPVREVVVGAFDHAMQGVFLAGIPIAVIGLVTVVFMRGVPLSGGTAAKR
ncbi:MDR family MFS transporter [Nocardiopsis sp. HUAS JQ3]|uniref:MDR family MFS transporter n=1 Tax=Nocardiopsis sp. HUAS JQ3 TaxID=3061629 RepID=UPI0023A99BAD|nr:MDR family MFS transporter [Nocardiopsis sp. HUAS JQ3]WDZ93774.1 MDR family MFS transporter [Nocardiopsis sp. HUAS JQ3]